MNNLKRILVIGIIVLANFSPVFALNLDNLRNYFLSGQYKICISEGEKLLAQASSNKDLEELYYILGLSYLKEGNYLRASDIFEIILHEYKSSRSFKEEAKLGLADSYFARGDYAKAKNIYQEMLKNSSPGKFKPALYYRLSQLAKRTGDGKQEAEYSGKLKSEFPQSPEALTNKEFFPGSVRIPAVIHVSPSVQVQEVVKPADANGEIIAGSYSVQVGAFSSLGNARSLALKLKAKGYFSYVSEAPSGNKKVYKVRVGGFSDWQAARAAEKKLKVQGYPTKIIP